MDRKTAFDEINSLQDKYVAELIGLMKSPDYSMMKTINFSSPTGTGKTKMMSKLINRFPDLFFIVTTLSKGQLHIQIRTELKKDCKTDNFYVYGSADYRINSKLDAEDILSRIPKGKDCIWIRDEGHIATNRWDEILLEACIKVINFSATNPHADIQCNFTQTMMLRTVNQNTGSPEDAINKLLEIKATHKNVPDYNPCAIFRCVDNGANSEKLVIRLCKKHNLKYINITDDSFVMSELCDDNNEYDVIINKFKIVEGIDIRRAHVLYMDNQPKNIATTIQAIGRCRRNALLYRDDIDILAPENNILLKQTRNCYVFYNVKSMKIDSDENGELFMAFCDHVSCEKLNANSTISVINGQLSNGLYVIELEGKTGTFQIITDKSTGYNIVQPITDFYKTTYEELDNYVYTGNRKISISNVKKLPEYSEPSEYGKSVLVNLGWKEGDPYYYLNQYYYYPNVKAPKDKCDLTPLLNEFLAHKSEYSQESITKRIATLPCYVFLEDLKDDSFELVAKDTAKRSIASFITHNKGVKGLTQFCDLLQKINSYEIAINEEKITLNTFFDDYSLYLIKYYLIMLKKNDVTNRVISDKLDSFLTVVKKLIPYKAKINWHVVIFLELKPDYMHKEILFEHSGEVKLTCNKDYNKAFVMNINAVYDYFENIEKEFFKPNLFNINKLYVSKDVVVKQIINQLKTTEQNLKKNIIDLLKVDYSSLYEPLTKEEEYLIYKKFKQNYRLIPKRLVVQEYVSYTKITNDKESAVIGTDLMHQIHTETSDVIWTESSSVTSKIGGYNKLNLFISRKYKDELEYAKSQCYNGDNHFDFNPRCNSMIGYCVEYYSKYLVYGEEYLSNNIQKAIEEFKPGMYRDWYKYNSKRDLIIEKGLMDQVIVRACMLKYKELMVRGFGYGVGRIISSISVDELVKPYYNEFVDTIVLLGSRTAEYVKKELYPNTNPCNNIDPNLSIQHITGLADYITDDTILDVKVRNNIDENCVRQVLAYHYLSTKRSDLHIKRVIVYDAVRNKAVAIDISNKNIK